MYNKFMKPSELNVTNGARVAVTGNAVAKDFAVNGYYGTVTEVFKGIDAENNEPYTNVRVIFDDNEDIAIFGQYQNGVYGCFSILRS